MKSLGTDGSNPCRLSLRRMPHSLMLLVLLLGQLTTSDPIHAQSDLSDRVQQHRAEVERRMEESRRRMEARRQEMSRSNASAAARRDASSRHLAPGYLQTDRERSPDTKSTAGRSAWLYIFHADQREAYAVEMTARLDGHRRRWAGVIVLATQRPTPLRDDGSPYDSAKLKVWGRLEGFAASGTGPENWRRLPGEDIVLPSSLVFRATGVGDYSMSESPRQKLPGEMHLRFGVLSAIFPTTPLFAKSGVEEKRPRSFLQQTTYGETGLGYTEQIRGLVTIQEKTSGNRYAFSETFVADQDSAGAGLAYTAQQLAVFHSTTPGLLEQSQATFACHGEGQTQVDIRVQRVSLADAISVLEPK